MARRTIVAGNWKLHGTAPEARRLIMALKHRLVGFSTRAEVVVCPPFPSLETAVDAARGSAIQVGAQNVFCRPWCMSEAYFAIIRQCASLHGWSP